MSLIKADLLRAAKWKSEPVQLPVSAREEPGLGSRLGGESRSPQRELGVLGSLTAGTAGCRRLRAHAGLPAPESRPGPR